MAIIVVDTIIICSFSWLNEDNMLLEIKTNLVCKTIHKIIQIDQLCSLVISD